MGVGMIVDNSIVVLENIYRYAANGHDRMTSCVEGTKEVTTSVVASTLTTVAVFLPIGLSGGIAGMLFDDFCLTISFLILSSMVVALTWVPVLCYMMLDTNKVRQQVLQEANKARKSHAVLDTVGGWIRKLFNAYLRLLDYFVRHLKSASFLPSPSPIPIKGSIWFFATITGFKNAGISSTSSTHSPQDLCGSFVGRMI